MRQHILALLGLLAILPALSLLVGCRAVRQVAAKYPAPDIGMVYLPEVQTAEVIAERNPLVVILGFGGSDLRDAEGRMVWGALHTDDSLSFGKPEGLRALALRIPEDFSSLSREAAMARLYHLNDDAVVAGPMLHFRTEFLAEVEFPVYAGLLVGLATAGYRLEPPEMADHLEVPRNPDGAPCFVFSYDWRRDLPSSAAALGRFLDRVEEQIQEERRLREDVLATPVRFDIVTHSMGGLITRYYLRYGGHDVLGAAVEDRLPAITWEGARRVDRAVLVSPPNLGTPKSLRNLANGMDSFFFPAYEPALVATWVSVPQMLPRREPGLLTDEAGNSVDLDYFDAAVWREYHWGLYRPDQVEILAQLFPDVADPEERLRRLDAFFAASLRRAERFERVMDAPAPPPPHTTLHLFAGDADPTLARGLAIRNRQGLQVVFDAPKGILNDPGDGSVTRRSSLGDLRPPQSREWLRSSVPWTTVFFLGDRHGTYLNNRVFQDNLLHLLLETPPKRGSR